MLLIADCARGRHRHHLLGYSTALHPAERLHLRRLHFEVVVLVLELSVLLLQAINLIAESIGLSDLRQIQKSKQTS